MRRFDDWLIGRIDAFGQKLQTENGYHYTSIVLYSLMFLVGLPTAAVFAEFMFGTAVFWFALIPYFFVWSAVWMLWVIIRRDRRSWDIRRVAKWSGLCLMVREKLFPLRVVAWAWLFVFGLGFYILLPLVGGGGIEERLLQSARNVIPATIKIGTATLYLYIACIMPIMPGERAREVSSVSKRATASIA